MKNAFQRCNSDQTLIFAHRGASAMAFENTMASFEEAIKQQADGIELDVRLTADGIPIVFHDADGLRLAGKGIRIADVPYSELSVVMLAGEHEIPRLDTVLDMFGERIFIDIEIKDKDAIPAVVDLIVHRHLVDQVMLSSFDRQAIIDAKNRLAQIRTGLIMGTRTLQPLTRIREAVPLLSLMHAHADYAVLHFRLMTGFVAFLLACACIPVMTWAGLDEEIADPGPYFRSCASRFPAAIVTAWPHRCRTFLTSISRRLHTSDTTC